MLRSDLADDAGGDSGLRATSTEDLTRIQEVLGRLTPPSWKPDGVPCSTAGCFITFPRGISGPGAKGDPAFAAAVIVSGGRLTVSRTVQGQPELHTQLGSSSYAKGRCWKLW